MKKEWLVEVLVGEHTYIFEYERKDIAMLDVDEILYGTVGPWVCIKQTYFRFADVKMVSYRKIT